MLSFNPKSQITNQIFLLIIALLITIPGFAQKKSATKPTQKNQTASKLATKSTVKETAKTIKLKDSKSIQAKPEVQARTNKTTKRAETKPGKAELAKLAEQNRQDALNRAAELDRIKERQAKEARRRQAAIDERNRREQAARKSREKQLAFERGLKTETAENIANDDTTGEDLEVRQSAIRALGNHAGTVVVMEPQTGKVLTVVNQAWGIREGFKPCSTIKLVTGIAGINENVITSDGAVRNRKTSINLDDALAHSNNGYFQAVGSNLGNEKMISYARALGLGQKTGINSEDEATGKLPYGNSNARVYSHGDDFEVTPIQLGVLVSAISNGGKMVIPRIPKTRIEQTNFTGSMSRMLNIPKNNLQRVLPGMIGAVSYGTAKKAANDSFNIAGKTGSCITQGTWIGLFASVAPVVNPKMVIVVVTRGAGERGKYSSQIAGRIYKSIEHRFNSSDNIASIPLELRPQQKVSAQRSLKIDNNEDEESDETAPTKTTVAKRTGGSKPTVQPLYEPIIIQVNSDQKRPRLVPFNH